MKYRCKVSHTVEYMKDERVCFREYEAGKVYTEEDVLDPSSLYFEPVVEEPPRKKGGK